MRELPLIIVLVLIVVHGTAHAQTQPSLSGTWSASPMHAQWSIGQWGAACGPRPSGGGSAAGNVTVEQVGAELSMSGLGRQWSTTECWEQYPGLVRRSHSAGSRGWRNVCKTADSDPRQATVVTTLSATDDAMSFDETGQYQFIIKGQNCTASVRRTRSFRLVQRAGDAAKQKDGTSTPTKPPSSLDQTSRRSTPKAGGRCATKGPPARLEVRPARKLMRAGETFTFRAQVLDKKGCQLGNQPTWDIVEGAELATLVGTGKVEIQPEAAEGEVKLTALVQGQAVEVIIEVVPSDRYEALLAQRGFNQAGESQDAAATTIAGGSIGAKSVVSQAGRSNQTILVAITGAIALVIGVLGLILVQRRRRRVPDARDSQEPGPGVSKRCPTCGRTFFGDEQFCTEDASTLIADGSPGTAPSAPPPVTKICPVCGTQYPGAAEFCGNDGSTLVPVN